MWLSAVSFREVVLLLPFATALHVYEEWPGFPRWARRFASVEYGDREYAITHAVTIGGSAIFAAVLWSRRSPWLVHGFFLFWLGPGVFWNAFFHVAASAVSRSYCPGAITGILLYIPLATALARLALREGILEASAVVPLLLLAAAVHAAEVGHNVFKRW